MFVCEIEERAEKERQREGLRIYRGTSCRRECPAEEQCKLADLANHNSVTRHEDDDGDSTRYRGTMLFVISKSKSGGKIATCRAHLRGRHRCKQHFLKNPSAPQAAMFATAIATAPARRRPPRRQRRGGGGGGGGGGALGIPSNGANCLSLRGGRHYGAADHPAEAAETASSSPSSGSTVWRRVVHSVATWSEKVSRSLMQFLDDL